MPSSSCLPGNAVGVGTALFYDPLILPRINRGITEYLSRHGLNHVGQLTGALAAQYRQANALVRLLISKPLTSNISVGLYSRHAPGGRRKLSTESGEIMSDVEALKAEKAKLIAEMLDMQKQFIDIEHANGISGKDYYYSQDGLLKDYREVYMQKANARGRTVTQDRRLVRVLILLAEKAASGGIFF